MRLVLVEIIIGEKFKIYAMASMNDQREIDCDTHDFFEKAEEKFPGNLSGLMGKLNHSSNWGPPKNEQQCRSVGGGVFELKQGSLRLFWFYDKDSVIICTGGYFKAKRKTQDNAIKLAQGCREKYFEAIKIKPLPIISETEVT
jgi:hypothetical protein